MARVCSQRREPSKQESSRQRVCATCFIRNDLRRLFDAGGAPSSGDQARSEQMWLRHRTGPVATASLNDVSLERAMQFLLRSVCASAATATIVLACQSAAAAPYFFSTGNPDGRIATLSRPASGGTIQTETADDFITPDLTRLTKATFVGLIPAGVALSSISEVEIEFYHVFPKDSANPPSGKVPTRVNSPGDVEIGAAT